MGDDKKRFGFLPNWRTFTYVIVVINILFLIWIISGVASTSGHAHDCGTLDQQTCDSAKNVGTAIGVGLIVVFWAIVDVILGVLWLVTRQRGRTCPACGTNAKRGQLNCQTCGFDFARAAVAGAARPTPPMRPIFQPVEAAIASASPAAPAAVAFAAPSQRAAGPPAGWYPDPRDASIVRWWDGLAWTAHTNQVRPDSAPAASPAAPVRVEPQPETVPASATRTVPVANDSPVPVAQEPGSPPAPQPAVAPAPTWAVVSASDVRVAMRIQRSGRTDMVGLIETLPDGTVRIHFLSGSHDDFAPTDRVQVSAS